MAPKLCGEHEPRERDVGLKLNVLMKLHANCNQAEILKRKGAK